MSLSGQKLDSQTIGKIAELHLGGVNNTQIALQLGLNRSTVNKYIATLKREGMLRGTDSSAHVSAHVSAQNHDWSKAHKAIQKDFCSVEQIANLAGATIEDVEKWLGGLKERHANIQRSQDDAVRLSKTPAIASYYGREKQVYVSRDDNTFVFGAVGDTHLCSKYERLEELHKFYELAQKEGVDRIFHTGNWIDGECHFNTHDIFIHGVTPQLKYLAENYPKAEGIVTYAVHGDDHEGWYGQKFGVDIGAMCADEFKRHGRNDWVDLGFMESDVALVNKNTGKESFLRIAHPGGGTAYALSYSVQKIIESYEGGDKPAVGLFGHYHKLTFDLVRNVFAVQTGCFQDQTPFMRKKRLEAHVGGTIVKLTQDPETGAIERCAVEIVRYFNKGYYGSDRWSKAGPAMLPPRG